MLLVSTNQAIDNHEAWEGHPERPARTRAALDGLVEAGLSDAVIDVPVRPATSDELHLVHPPAYLAWLETFSSTGGGRIDGDTAASTGSWETALSAAGAGLATVAALEAGRGEAGLVLARPPGHHAGPEQAMGFCLLNNLAVTAAHLVNEGNRVAIVDWDVHHGNGTQEIFWDDPEVLFVSLHQRGLYPGTGSVVETGGPAAAGTNLNIPLPPGAAGGAMRAAFERLVAPSVGAFGPDWLLVSAGFDGHRADPLSDWQLTAGDYADLAAACRSLAPQPGRVLAFLEGGYDLAALRMSVGAVGAALLGETYRPEVASNGSVGIDDIDKIAQWRARQPWAAAPPSGPNVTGLGDVRY